MKKDSGVKWERGAGVRRKYLNAKKKAEGM